MATYFNLTSTCSGKKEQHDFCSQDSCDPEPIYGYKSFANLDQEGGGIKKYKISEKKRCEKECTRNKKCIGLIMKKDYCWTMSGTDSSMQYKNVGSVIYSKLKYEKEFGI